jgi:starvation-inducible DNA-binding protein
VEGQAFFPLHEVLQERYEALAEEIDEVAERVLKLGRRPVTKLADFVRHAQLDEAESRGYSGQEVAEEICSDLSTLIDGLRETIEVSQEHGDEGTADDAIAMLKDKEKQLWMFDAYRK